MDASSTYVLLVGGTFGGVCSAVHWMPYGDPHPETYGMLLYVTYGVGDGRSHGQVGTLLAKTESRIAVKTQDMGVFELRVLKVADLQRYEKSIPGAPELAAQFRKAEDPEAALQDWYRANLWEQARRMSENWAEMIARGDTYETMTRPL